MRKLVILAIALGALLAMGLVGFADYRANMREKSKVDSYGLMVTAREKFATGDMDEAERMFREAAVQQETNGEAWFMYALCRHYAKDWTGARSAFQKSIKLNYLPGIGYYNMACGYAREGKIDEALKHLELALDKGFSRTTYLTSDPDLKNLRSDPRFHELLAKVGPRLGEDPVATMMADWLGEWDVYDGEKWIGSAQYVEAMNGYAIEMHFANYTGAMSQGLYTFDSTDKIWRRMMVNESGRISESIGKMDGEALVFEGEVNDPQTKKKYRERFTWTSEPDGKISVKVLTSDDGKTWKDATNLTYVRHTSQ